MGTIHFTKLGRFAQVQIDLGDIEKTQQPLYISASDITVDYNILTNKVTVNVNAVRSFISEDITTGGAVYFDITNSGSFTAVTTKSEFDTNFALLFPDEGGGSGTTPNLDQVCTEGNSTTQNIISTDIIGDDLARRTVILPGLINIQNDLQNNVEIKNNGTVATNQLFQLPDKGGTDDTFAMLSDIAGILGLNLQECTDNGNSTTNAILSASGSGLQSSQLRYTNPFAPNPGLATGIIDLINSLGNQVSIINNLSTFVGQQYYRLPDKLGVTDTFAMVTDLPLSGPYAPTILNPINCSVTRDFVRYTINNNVVRTVWMSFQFHVATAGNGICSFEIQNPVTVSGTPATAGTLIAEDSGGGKFLPGRVKEGTAANQSILYFEEDNGAVNRIISGTMIFTTI